MKIIFAGTTQFGIPTLEILNTKYQIPLIITQPDQPVGRKKVLTPPPIKVWAEKNGIPVEQPEKIRDLLSVIRDLNPDLLLVAAYGQIIPNEVLDIPRYGAINIHGSLLPKYRGATPIQTAILNNDKITGITLIKMDEKMDHGPIIACASIDIEAKDTYQTLHEKLSLLAAELTSGTLPDWFAGKIEQQAQDESKATFTKILTLNDGRIDWTKPADKIGGQIRALHLEPGAWTTFDQKSVKILEAENVAQDSIELAGKILDGNKELLIKCQTGALKIHKLQPEGKKPMSGKDFLNGLKGQGNKLFV